MRDNSLSHPGREEGGMRRVGPHSFTEIYYAGCNPSFVETSDGYVMIDTPQQPIDAVRWREMMEEKAPIRYLINTEPHGDISRATPISPTCRWSAKSSSRSVSSAISAPSARSTRNASG